jgi:phosphoglycerate kinase
VSLSKKGVSDIDVSGKRVLVRVDFNVPLDEGEVADDMRIRASLPTIRYLRQEKARIILCSHLGRPKGEVVEKLRLDPVAQRLADLLDTEVKKADDCVGQEAEQAAEGLDPGEVLLLENTRFHPGEKANDPEFARLLASVAGFLMKREVEALQPVRDAPEQPFILILGGAKVADKIGVIRHFMHHTHFLLVGGGMASTLLRAQGFEMAESLVEEESLDTARRILSEADKTLVLPEDVVIADGLSADVNHRVIDVGNVPSGWQIVDVGPETIDLFEDSLQGARTVVWNGPVGVFEIEPFGQGTFSLARILSRLDATTIVGGGDTAAAVHQAGVAEKMTHVSTGGGAFLAFIEGEELPGLAALDDK